MKLRALFDKVIVRPVNRENRSPIVPGYKDPPHEGSVISAGAERRRKDGTLVPSQLYPGALVEFHPFAGKEIEWQGEKLRVLKHNEINAVLTG